MNFLECPPVIASAQRELKDLFGYYQVTYLHTIPVCKRRDQGTGWLNVSPTVAEGKCTRPAVETNSDIHCLAKPWDGKKVKEETPAFVFHCS